MYDVALGNRLKILRERKNLTQSELAKAMGISLSSVQHHEAGGSISKKFFRKYIDCYGCDRNWLLIGIGEPYLNKNGKGDGIPNVRELREEYKIGTPGLGQAVDMLAAVLDSGNDALIHSLISHLAASKEAVNQMKNQNQQISNLISELNDVRKRLAALEKKLEKESDLEKQENVEKKAM